VAIIPNGNFIWKGQGTVPTQRMNGSVAAMRHQFSDDFFRPSVLRRQRRPDKEVGAAPGLTGILQ
jgi:hypothetical protein